jgi:hypothetical protein
LCGELDIAFLRAGPDAKVKARWQFRKEREAFVRPPGCDHLIVDGLELRAVGDE